MNNNDTIRVEKGVNAGEIILPKSAYNRIILEDNSSAVIISEENDVENRTEIIVGENAHLDFVDYNPLATERHAKVHENAKINWYLLNIDNEKSQVRIQSHVVGRGGESNIYLVSHILGSQKMDYFICNIFDAKDCKGFIGAKSVVADSANLALVGEIEITLKGAGTDSYLKQEILMLDSEARVNAVPSLKIKTNDVKAGHGVTVTKLTEDSLFYLMSRGISRVEAKKLVLAGFLKDMYSKFPVLGIIDKLNDIYE